MMFERGLGALLTPWYCDYSPKVGRHGGEQLYNHPIINNTDSPSMQPITVAAKVCVITSNMLLQYKS